MTPQLQSIVALMIVASAVTWMIARAVAKRNKPGCGGDCGCPSSELKAKLKP